MKDGKNTCISYVYRDGSNYKRSKEVVVAGCLTHGQIAPHLSEDVWFIPGEIGLPDPQQEWEAEGYAFPGEDDHVWCELEEDACEPTDDPPTVKITADELLARFKKAGGQWDVEAATARLGLDCKAIVPERTRIVRVRCEACPEWRPLVEVPEDATEEQMRILAARVACHDGPSHPRLEAASLVVEEVGRIDLRFQLGTRGHWHLVEEAEEAAGGR